MRSFVLGIVILIAAPAYALGQQRDPSARSATGRTAIPRDAVQAAPARQSDRRAEPRSETGTASSREGRSNRAEPPTVVQRHAPSALEMVRGRLRGQLPQAAPAFIPWTTSPRVVRAPSSIARPARGLRHFPNREYRRPTQIHRYHRPRYGHPHNGANIVFVPYAAPMVVEREVVIERNETIAAPVVVEPPALARLILDVHPATAQIFADGYYIGIPEDFRFEDGGAVLEPGPHRIDIVAHDYESVSFDVNLARGQSATFRRSLTPIKREPQPAPDAAQKGPAVVKQPVTFYLIPGCYMGNVPPREANLPVTCDIARAVSFQY